MSLYSSPIDPWYSELSDISDTELREYKLEIMREINTGQRRNFQPYYVFAHALFFVHNEYLWHRDDTAIKNRFNCLVAMVVQQGGNGQDAKSDITNQLYQDGYRAKVSHGTIRFVGGPIGPCPAA